MCGIYSCRLMKGENCMTLSFFRGRVGEAAGREMQKGSEAVRWESDEMRRWEVPGFSSRVGDVG